MQYRTQISILCKHLLQYVVCQIKGYSFFLFFCSLTLPCFQISLYQVKIKIKCKKCGLCQYVELYNISCILHIYGLASFPRMLCKRSAYSAAGSPYISRPTKRAAKEGLLPQPGKRCHGNICRGGDSLVVSELAACMYMYVCIYVSVIIRRGDLTQTPTNEKQCIHCLNRQLSIYRQAFNYNLQI